MGTVDEGFRYANLAIRGRKLRQVLDEQLQPALDLKPELVTLYAGGNDILRPSVDVDVILGPYADAVAELTRAGIRVLLFTGFDLGEAPLLGRLRGRVAVYNEIVREIADTHGAGIVDFWRMREHRDWRLWDVDRIHMSTLGHRHMAVAVLDVLGVPHDVRLDPLAAEPPRTRAEQRRADLVWARTHATPWVQRRLTGRSSGDGVSPRYPELVPFGPDGPRERQAATDTATVGSDGVR
jgi:lysophospholipase L1-like esterase